MDESDTTGQEMMHEYLAALNVLRIANNAFFWLALVAVLLHLGAWLNARYADHDLTSSASDQLMASGEVHERLPISTGADDRSVPRWREGMKFSLIVAGFIGRASVLILVGITFTSLMISLSGKAGGAASIATSCVWLLAALAMLTPWVRAGPEQMPGLYSMFSTMDEIGLTTIGGHGFWQGALSIIRFVLCPLFVIGCLVQGQLCFRRANRMITALSSPRLPIREL